MWSLAGTSSAAASTLRASRNRSRRASEQRYNLAQTHREVEEAVRSAWNERKNRSELAGSLLASSRRPTPSSFRPIAEQFKVGQRSLLDVLDAQNTRFNTSVLAQTARFAALFAEYKILAASGNLVKTMNLKPIEQGEGYARQEFSVPATAAQPQYVEVDSRQSAGVPFDLLAPIRSQ